MLKNVRLKKILKRTVFPALSMVNRFIPKDENIVFLYSANRGIWNNLKALKDYLLSNHYDEKYKIVCGIESSIYAENDKARVKYVSGINSILYFLRSKHVYYTAGQIPIKPSTNQIVIHLDHGSANLKRCGALTNINNGDEFYFTYYLAPSEIYIDIICKTYLCRKENVLICGEASTDIMYGGYDLYDLGDFNKIILWAPTFRQSDYIGYDDSSEEELLPMFAECDYKELNAQLAKYRFKLIVKIHPAQDLNRYKELHFSNLFIYSDEEFRSKGYDLYNLMPQIDYMIADYSSVYLQFLLLNRPIAFAIPDYDEYSKKRGFVFDDAKRFMPGEKLQKKEELYEVFAEWSKGIDRYKDERVKVCNLIHKYQDGNNAKRALIISNIQI